MAEVTRHHIGQRMSQIVRHASLIYLAGQCGTAGQSVAEQTRESLEKIDGHLAQLDADKSRILKAEIWLEDIRDFDEMNAVWEAWAYPNAAPARACGQARLAGSGYKVEIIITAAA